MKILKIIGSMSVWMLGGKLIGMSFSALNSFSAEMIFTTGALLIVAGFYLSFKK